MFTYLLRIFDDLSLKLLQESGSPLPVPDITASQPSYDQLVKNANCTNALDTLDCLRDAPVEVILDYVNQTPSFLSERSSNLFWTPTVDGCVIERNPQEAVRLGLYSKVNS